MYHDDFIKYFVIVDRIIVRILILGLKLLTIERVFLDRLLYKHHNRFRNDRGYKSLRILLKSGINYS